MSCNVRSAHIEWASSFDGGATQTFIALAIIAQQDVSRSESLSDRGESKIHFTQLQNLQPSTKYTFYLVAQNKHGNSTSEKRECKTLDDGMFYHLIQNTINIPGFMSFYHKKQFRCVTSSIFFHYLVLCMFITFWSGYKYTLKQLIVFLSHWYTTYNSNEVNWTIILDAHNIIDC